MADYCYDCTRDVLGVDPTWNDFGSFEATGPRIPEGELWKVLCEGCGIIIVDSEGKKIKGWDSVLKKFSKRIDEDEEPKS